MKIIKKLTLLSFILILSGCSTLDIYKNADEPVDWTGKENWGLLSVKKNGGRVLVSPRPRDNAFKAVLSTGNYNARSQILLKPGINDINVYAMTGSGNALFTIENIEIKEYGRYQLQYELDGRKISTKIVDVTDDSKQPEVTGSK